MSNPSITLHGVSHGLPDGRSLFSDLNETFDARPTGLVGRNGVGKSVLGRILAGQLAPTAGRCTRSGPVHHLAQHVAPRAGDQVATLAGVAATLAALARIEAGSADPVDFDTVGTQWDVRQRLEQALQTEGLGHLCAQTPASQLSGGEALRVALIGAWLAEADFLILDEPTNHLDAPSRRALIERLRQWPRGLIVISHDRRLLDTLDRIVELVPAGLRSYGGNYTMYAQARDAAQASAAHLLAHHQEQRRRETRKMRDVETRQAQRQARGGRDARQTNQAKILLDRQKGRSETTAGRLRLAHAARHEALAADVRAAASSVDMGATIAVHAPDAAAQVASQRIAVLTEVALPFVTGPTRDICLTLYGRQRVGVAGANGCGKSTLLRVLAGELAPDAGTVSGTGRTVYLDQTLAGLDPAHGVLAQLRQANPKAPDGDLRMRLAHLGLGADKVHLPSGKLSGGERLKGALACILYADTPPALLLLDEPSNHLDLASTEALETMLRAYEGAMMVVSHDEAFLAALELDELLVAQATGWAWMPTAVA